MILLIAPTAQRAHDFICDQGWSPHEVRIVMRERDLLGVYNPSVVHVLGYPDNAEGDRIEARLRVTRAAIGDQP